MVWTELHSHRPMQQGPRFYIPRESTCLSDAYCYEFRDRESYDRFALPLERELIVKNLLFDSLIIGRSFENLFYLSSRSLSQRRFRIISSNILRGIESDLPWTKVSGVVSQYILRSGSLLHPLNSSMVKNKQIFWLIISKLISAFSLCLYNLV